MDTLNFASRRRFIVNAAGSALSAVVANSAAAKIQGFDSTQHDGAIRRVGVGSPITVPNNYGDTWVAAWADDDNLYVPSNDTLGFDIPSFVTRQELKLFSTDLRAFAKALTQDQKNQFRYSPLAFNRVQGSAPSKLRGVTVNWMADYLVQDGYQEAVEGKVNQDQLYELAADRSTWKSSGCSFIDGALYWVIHRDKLSGGESGKARQISANGSIIKSIDYGKSWTRSAKENLASPMFPGQAFATPYFVDYGRETVSVDGADRYVYAIANNGFWDNGDRLILGRVPRTRIGLLRSLDWQFFGGGDGLLDANWVSGADTAKPILEGTRKFGGTGAVYLPTRQRYVMISWYYPGGEDANDTTVWDFYEAPHPWGPWTHIDSHRWSPQGYYCPAICPKFKTANRVYVLTAGAARKWWDYYRLTVVPVDLR